MLSSYLIPVAVAAEAIARIERVARKAAKLGVAAVMYRNLGREMRPVLDSDGKETGESEPVMRIEVSAPVVKLNGWLVLCQLQHEDNGNIIRFIDLSLPEGVRADITETYGKIDGICQHCGHNRRRLVTYLLLHEKGNEIKQVGSSCVQDFTGGHDVNRLLGLMEDLGSLLEGELNDYAGKGDRRFYYVRTVEFLSHVAAMIRINGWSPASKNPDMPTRDQASANMRMLQRREKGAINPEAIDVETAEKTMEWVRSLPYSRYSRSDYLNNLFVSMSDDTSPRNLGIVASSVAAYQREMGQIAERTRSADGKVSVHQGKLGERLKGLRLTVETIKDIQTAFGASRITTMADSAGNVFVWFASGERLEIGESVTLTGTVKEHKVYGGVAQTVLTRCAIEVPKNAPCSKAGCRHGMTAKRGRYICDGCKDQAEWCNCEERERTACPICAGAISNRVNTPDRPVWYCDACNSFARGCTCTPVATGLAAELIEV